MFRRIESDALSFWNDNDAKPVFFFSARLRTGDEGEEEEGTEIMEDDMRRFTFLRSQPNWSRLKGGDIFAAMLVNINKPPAYR